MTSKEYNRKSQMIAAGIKNQIASYERGEITLHKLFELIAGFLGMKEELDAEAARGAFGLMEGSK